MLKTARRPSESLLIAGTNLALAASGTLSGILLARALGPGDRGAFAAIFTWLIVLQALGEMGLYSSAVHYSAKDRSVAMGVARRVALLILLQTVACSAILIILAAAITRSEHTYPLPWLIALAISLPVVATLGAFPFALYGCSIQQWNRARLLQAPIWICGLILVAWLGGLTPVRALVVYTISIVCSTLYALYLLTRHTMAPTVNSKVPSPRRLYLFGLPSLGFTAPVMLSTRTDQLVLSVMSPPYDLGVYTVAAAWTAALTPALTAMGNAAFPRLSSMEPHERNTLAIATIKRTRYLAAVASLCTALMAPLAIPFLFGSSYSSAIALCFTLAPLAWAAAVRQTAGDVLRGIGEPRAIASVEIIGLLLAIPAIAIGFDFGGLIGAAIAASSVAVSVALTGSSRAIRLSVFETRNNG